MEVIGIAVGMEAVIDGGGDEAAMDTLIICVTMRVERQMEQVVVMVVGWR